MNLHELKLKHPQLFGITFGFFAGSALAFLMFGYSQKNIQKGYIMYLQGPSGQMETYPTVETVKKLRYGAQLSITNIFIKVN